MINQNNLLVSSCLVGFVLAQSFLGQCQHNSLKHTLLMSISRQLRIIAIPIAQPNFSRNIPLFMAKPSRRVVCYQFQTALEPSKKIRSELDVAKWVTEKAADVWI